MTGLGSGLGSGTISGAEEQLTKNVSKMKTAYGKLLLLDLEHN